MIHPSALDEMYEYSKDDHAAFVGSDIRQLIGEIRRLREVAVAPLNREQIARTIAKYMWCGATYDNATEAEKDAFVNAADAVLALSSPHQQTQEEK